ncbi:MAG TPA: nucleoside monophosphate kinase [Patescibacteria group bacterium]|nr:nucleoside monophosphate kinase [Patescibacteria group bacterium]
MQNFSLLGPPGSGKSTQAEFLKKEFHLVHIDIGSELRAVAENGTDIGRMVDEIIHHRRELVPDHIMKEIFRQAIARVPQTQGVILDGAPRYVSQVDELLQICESFGRVLTKVIFIDLSLEESIARISKRYLCFACHRPYMLGTDITLDDTVCRICGGRIGQRKDDTPDGVRKRFTIFQSETAAVIEYFAKQGLLLRVDGKQDPQVIFQDIVKHITIGTAV